MKRYLPGSLLTLAAVMLAGAVRRLNSLIAGSLVVVVLIALSVLTPALSANCFERAVLSHVDRQAVGMSKDDLTVFARETIAYLRGSAREWEPQTPFAIPDTFRGHMADVRDAIRKLGWFGALALPSLVLACVWPREKWLWTGCGVTVALLAAALLWAAVDFESLWMVIHRLFIPGGIFPAGEPVMRLFPLSLFYSYIKPVVWCLAGYSLALAGSVMIIRRKRRGSTEE